MPDDLAAVRRVELTPLGEELRDDRGRGHRGDSAEGEPRLPRGAGGKRGGERQHDRRGHLGKAEPEHRATHGKELRQAEFEPDREHEEHHAELREPAGFLDAGDQPQRVRA